MGENELILPANVLKNLFRNVYFINGTAYAGKSTAVRMLAEKYDGIECGENYHGCFNDLTDVEHQPNLGYFKTMSGWQEFLNRTPEKYAAWIRGSSHEAEQLEIIRLIQLAAEGKRIFVDTNISVETLRKISDREHVAILLSPQSMSVERFFDRNDPDKRFLLEQIGLAEDPEKTMANFRACMARINSKEVYDAFANSGFFTMVRYEGRTFEELIAGLAEHFGLE